MADDKTKIFDNPLSGKLITAYDPILIQPTDFQECTNLRPTDGNPKGVQGMTKINAAATSYKGIKTGFNFKKDQPAESHIIVQTNDISAPATASRLIKSDNTAAIPAQDTFSTFKALANNNPVYMTKAPDGCVAAFNDNANYIWGGSESRCFGFMVFDPNNTSSFFDYTDVINNTLSDAQNVATMKVLGGGIDTYTKGVWHFNTDYTDSSGEAHTLTNSGCSIETGAGLYKFGAGGLNCAGYAYRDVTGDADFDLSGGIFTIDFWDRRIDFSADRSYFQFYKDATNYFQCYVTMAGVITVSLVVGGAQKIGASGLSTPAGTIDAAVWHHIEVSRDGSDNWYIFVDGIQIVTTSDADKPAADYVAFRIGYSTVQANSYGYIDEFRFSNGICRHTAAFILPVFEYSATAGCYLRIGSTRPLKGIKVYIGTANTTAATVAGTYWNGAETALSNVVDNTDTVATKTLSGTGTITFDDTQTDAKVKIINGQMLYWYTFVFTGIDDTTTIYYCTLDSAIQPVKDIWDGAPRPILEFLTYSTLYNDLSVQVYKNDYVITDSGTYCNIADMLTTYHLLLGFAEQMTAIYFYLAESYVNTTADTVCTIEYWNGTSWVTVGTLDDGTAQGGISFSRSGIISWDAISPNTEFTMTPNNGVPLYHYKVTFSETVDNTDSKVYLHYVTGIPAQKELPVFKFPLFWQNRLFGFYGNRTRYSSLDTNCIFNGTDAGDFSIDGEDECVCGETLFTRFGGDVYDSAVVCKKTQTFLLDVDPDNYSSFKTRNISPNKGCVAPYTMKLCDIGFDVAQNIKKHVLLWLSDDGLVVFDGVSMSSASDDFSDYFDRLSDHCINWDYVDLSYGSFDPVEREYHLFIPTGAATTPNTELVYRLKKQSYFPISRGTGKALQCAFQVQDTRGVKYLYGGTRDGYIERLEYGTTMDGNSIVYTFRNSDFNLSGKSMTKANLKGIQLTGKAKTVTAQNITVTHYLDGNETGTTLTPTLSPVNAGYRIFKVYTPINGQIDEGIFHSTKYTITTDDENRGFEPLLLSYVFDISDEVSF